MQQFREEFTKTGFKFPIRLQTTMKAVCNRLGFEESTFYKSYRTSRTGNINHVANNFEQVESILRRHLNEIIEETTTNEGDSDTGVYDVTSCHVRFWEYRPSVIRKANSIYAKGNGFIETPEWLKNRKAVINIKNTDDQCFIKCLYRLLTMIRRTEIIRDVNSEELAIFRKKFNCRAITDVYVDIGLFEEDNPSISIDIYGIPFKEEEGVSLIYIGLKIPILSIE
jgi:hypothetical protein